MSELVDDPESLADRAVAMGAQGYGRVAIAAALGLSSPGGAEDRRRDMEVLRAHG